MIVVVAVQVVSVNCVFQSLDLLFCPHNVLVVVVLLCVCLPVFCRSSCCCKGLVDVSVGTVVVVGPVLLVVVVA